MTRKQRLSLEARILSSIDARRKRTGDRASFVAVERAIVVRELAQLDGDELADQKSAFRDTCFKDSVETDQPRSEHVTRAAEESQWRRH